MQAGAGVWDGILDSRPTGACTQAFPLYRTSRIVAGAPIEGGIYNCARKAVATAVADGTYGPWTPNAAEVAMLQQIFPKASATTASPIRRGPDRRPVREHGAAHRPPHFTFARRDAVGGGPQSEPVRPHASACTRPVHCGADDRQALEQLCRYITRPALANERVQLSLTTQRSLWRFSG